MHRLYMLCGVIHYFIKVMGAPLILSILNIYTVYIVSVCSMANVTGPYKYTYFLPGSNKCKA